MEKHCNYCKAELTQRPGERNYLFNKRKYCNQSCANKDTVLERTRWKNKEPTPHEFLNPLAQRFYLGR